MKLRNDADQIIKKSIQKVLPDEAVFRALRGKTFGSGKIYVTAVGKAAWQMAKAASDVLGERITDGVVITKYDHVKGEIPHIRCFEAGHPVPDQNSFAATEEAICLVDDLKQEDTVLPQKWK